MKLFKNFPVASTLLLLSALFISSCESESNELFLDETDEVYQLYDYYVDQDGNEGIVAYIRKDYDNELDYKYVIVLSLDESLQPWGPMDDVVYKRDSVSTLNCSDDVFGLAMCQSMSNAGIYRYPAQSWCFSKNSKKAVNSGSWRLPSRHELFTIFGSSGGNVSALNKAISKVGGTLIDNDKLYWTCTEDIDNYISLGSENGYDQANRAILTSPVNTSFSNKDRWLKKNKYYVRAIRYIYYHY